MFLNQTCFTDLSLKDKDKILSLFNIHYIMAKPPFSIFEIQVSEEYRPCLEDIIRLCSIQIMVNLLLYSTEPSRYPFLGKLLLRNTLFIIVGVAMYWLVIRRVIRFYSREHPHDTTFYFGSSPNDKESKD